MDFLPIKINSDYVYAGFSKRFAAGFIDLLVLIPISFLIVWIQGFDKNIAILIAIPSTALFSMYNVYFNARFGGTLGKLAVKIRITRPNGTPIGWIEAWKRSSVDLVFAFFMLIVKIFALTQISNVDYTLAASWIERVELLTTYYPKWYSVIDILSQVWIWSELIVLLFNERKRAIHDFIAGTVVIHKEYTKSE